MPRRSSPFQLIAGDIALDLVNTVSWRGDLERRIERIPDFKSLAQWSARAGLADVTAARTLVRAAARDCRRGEEAVSEARGLREDLHTVIASLLDGAGPPLATLRSLQVRFMVALRAASVSSLPLNWSVPLDSPEGLVNDLALRALRLLQSDEVYRIGRCSDRACGWIFIDRSRNHSRRWCSSTDCGNRDRAARSYARSRSR
jgi:predicted RNA-binding Zn ribbon-like protein